MGYVIRSTDTAEYYMGSLAIGGDFIEQFTPDINNALVYDDLRSAPKRLAALGTSCEIVEVDEMEEQIIEVDNSDPLCVIQDGGWYLSTDGMTLTDNINNARAFELSEAFQRFLSILCAPGGRVVMVKTTTRRKVVER